MNVRCKVWKYSGVDCDTLCGQSAELRQYVMFGIRHTTCTPQYGSMRQSGEWETGRLKVGA